MGRPRGLVSDEQMERLDAALADLPELSNDLDVTQADHLIVECACLDLGDCQDCEKVVMLDAPLAPGEVAYCGPCAAEIGPEEFR